MPTNENTYNSRVTSEALEAKFRQVFPSQGGAELVDDLYASGVIQPVIDFSSVAEGSVLSPELQTAWDFSTGHNTVSLTTTTVISNPGFWKIDANLNVNQGAGGSQAGNIKITDGITAKAVFAFNETNTSPAEFFLLDWEGIVYLRAGDSVQVFTNSNECIIEISYRQIADVNGNLVNPLGFTFS